MDLITVSKEKARDFLVTRQGFHGAHGKYGALETIKRVECIQIDPVNVVHRNHQLVLHSRVIGYKPSYLDALLYQDRAVFEYWCNAKSIIPIQDFRYFNYRMQKSMEFHSPFYERLKARRAELKAEISYVLSTIRAKGTLSASDFGQYGRISSRTAQKVLNLLWDLGTVMIHHAEKNRRYYDLTERVLPAGISTGMPSREEYEEFMLSKYMRAYGLVDVRDWRFGWFKLKAAQRKRIVKEMVAEGRLCPVRIEGVKYRYYVLEEDADMLQHPEGAPDESVCFVPPLDNLIWNRRMVAEVFDFDYSWEIYKPREERVYGYYVIPILYGSRFVGRMDPKLDRKDKKMIINSLLLGERWLSRAVVLALTVALESFLRFHRALEIEIVRTQPSELRNLLLSELNPNA